MQITDILTQMGGLKSIAQELGVSETQAASGADALIPAILGGLKKQTQTQAQASDAAGLAGLLGQLGGSGLLDDVLSSRPTNISRGNDVLGQLFGSKDVSRAVAQNAASQSQLSPDLLKKMLPILAMLVTGLMAKNEGANPQSSPLGDGLGQLLGGVFGNNQATGKATGGLAAMLDLNGDGNALDDVMHMAGKLMR
ncbi:DUF937 domain-containing protein [Castellaniella sp.]|uniref:DUF937 domain-containing protein n=1 Tax=Castellaniella sp. TaxID=1955812 RepID=UPI002AFDCA05|nr:DUF937 domain-containing protein [Castellaniella sp.]